MKVAQGIGDTLVTILVTLVTRKLLGSFAKLKYCGSESPYYFMTLLEKIPTVVTVAVLVGIFLALKRHSHSARLQLWMVAWFLIFTHFVAQMLEPRDRRRYSLSSRDRLGFAASRCRGVCGLCLGGRRR